MPCPVCPCADCVTHRQASAPKRRGGPPKRRGEAPLAESLPPIQAPADEPIETRACAHCEVPCIGYPGEFKGDPFVCERCDPSRYEPWVFFLRLRRDVEAAEARKAAHA